MPNSAWLSSPELYNDVPVHRCLGCPFGEVAWTEMLWAQLCRGCSRDAALPGHTGLDPKGPRVCCAPPIGITLPVFSQIPQAPSWVGLALLQIRHVEKPNPNSCLPLPHSSWQIQELYCHVLVYEHQPILVLFDCELWKIQQAASTSQIPGSSSPFTWCMELQILSNDQLHFWPHWAPWQSLGVVWLFLFLSE